MAKSPEFAEQAAALLALCRGKGLTIATAESCTGGLVAATLTEIPGSSDVVERGFVTYSNAAKQSMLGVPAAILAQFGAVSRECAEAMATGAIANSPAHIAVSITGNPVSGGWRFYALRMDPGGPGARRHLMSPAMAAAAAVTGHLTDVRTLERGR